MKTLYLSSHAISQHAGTQESARQPSKYTNPGLGCESRKISRKELGKKKGAIMVACKTSAYNQQEIGEFY
ncbi:MULTISPECIES: hypothetical protein [Nitrosomonas]|uniref:hypothetical protein n=1 Tax=Nitrosomonas TaxID=914 RepID=UPI00130D5CC2|nr:MULTISPECIES: hypothetical protein [Nitrosomonas]UVS62121.1 hypothetical protein NX761_03025 [Nitrosomonas sp. PLL12]